jgi:hypothetical protein
MEFKLDEGGEPGLASPIIIIRILVQYLTDKLDSTASGSSEAREQLRHHRSAAPSVVLVFQTANCFRDGFIVLVVKCLLNL